MTALERLQVHVQAFNEGVRTGDFSRMVEGFAPDAVMSFENIPAGPFEGQSAIAAAYSENPPTDEIVVLRTRIDENYVIAEFAWSSSPDVRGGDLEISDSPNGISRLLIIYGGPATRW